MGANDDDQIIILGMPPVQPFSTNSVSIVQGGIVSTSFSAGAITAAALAAGALAGQIINRIQYGTITYGSGATSASATITAVDLSKAVLLFLGEVCPASSVGPANQSYASQLSRITMASTTSVSASRFFGTDAAGTNQTGTVNFCVVEFK